MMNEQEYFEQCMSENPTQTATINGVEVQLTEQECIDACRNWAIMKVEQDQNPQPKN